MLEVKENEVGEEVGLSRAGRADDLRVLEALFVCVFDWYRVMENASEWRIIKNRVGIDWLLVVLKVSAFIVASHSAKYGRIWIT